MALLVAEGFDDISTTAGSLLGKTYWSGAAVTTDEWHGRIAGRYHGFALESTPNGLYNLIWALPGNLPEIYAAFAIRRTTATLVGEWVVELNDGSSNQVDLRTSGDGTLSVTRNGTLLGSAADVFPIHAWVWLSIRAVIDDTAGIVEVKDAAGATLLNLTGVNTQDTGNAWVNSVRLWGGGSDRAWDDVFIMDAAGSTFNGHLPERAIRMLQPDADGDTLQWAANTGARWEAVGEQAPDDDTSYISSSTPGDINLSRLADLAAAESGIAAVILQHRTRKDDAGARSARGVIRAGAANYPGTTQALTAGYIGYADKWEINPHTGAAWTRANVADLQAGVETVS